MASMPVLRTIPAIESASRQHRRLAFFGRAQKPGLTQHECSSGLDAHSMRDLMFKDHDRLQQQFDRYSSMLSHLTTLALLVFGLMLFHTPRPESPSRNSCTCVSRVNDIPRETVK
jgi:hypothetical protein